MNRPQHIKSLDGLRAIAIILVLMWHSSQTIWYTYGRLAPIGDWDIGVIFRNGWIGVDLFFVLSGYLITKTFVHKDIKGFFIRRALKILPAYYVILMVYCCIIAMVTYLPNDLWSLVWPQLIFMNDYQAENINGPLWSVAVEVKFYILAPFILTYLFMSRMKPMAKVSAMFLVSVTFPLIVRLLVYYFYSDDLSSFTTYFLHFRKPFPTNLEGILLGMTIGLLDRYPEIQINLKKAKVIFMTGMAAFVILMVGDNMVADLTFYDISFEPIVNSLIMAALVLGCVKGGGAAFLETKSLNLIAKVSYSLYLVHYPIVLMMKKPFNAATLDLAISPFSKYMLFVVPFLVVSSLAAFLLYHFVEKPFLKLKPKSHG